jgi:hypothetical protein
MGQYKDLLENILKEELNPDQQEALNKVKSGIPGSFRKPVPAEFRKKKVVAPAAPTPTPEHEAKGIETLTNLGQGRTKSKVYDPRENDASEKAKGLSASWKRRFHNQ